MMHGSMDTIARLFGQNNPGIKYFINNYNERCEIFL